MFYDPAKRLKIYEVIDGQGCLQDVVDLGETRFEVGVECFRLELTSGNVKPFPVSLRLCAGSSRSSGCALGVSLPARLITRSGRLSTLPIPFRDCSLMLQLGEEAPSSSHLPHPCPIRYPNSKRTDRPVQFHHRPRHLGRL